MTLAAPSAMATDLDATGGNGGGPFRVTCQPGSYIVGVAGRVGEWIDQVSMQCAHWNDQTHRLEPPSLAQVPIGTSNGGRALATYCPNGSVVQVLTITSLSSDNRLIANLYLTCHFVEGNGPDTDIQFGEDGVVNRSSLATTFVASVQQECPSNELAVGLHGRSGLFIDAIGLVCGPAPKAGLTAAALGGINGGRVPVSAATAARSDQWAAPTPARNTTAGQLAAASPTSIPAPAPGPTPFDLPEGPTAGVPIARGVRYSYPFINDYSMNWGLLDWCRESATNCGAPAANAYCRAVDGGQHPHALEFATFNGAGRYRPTINVATRTSCTAKSCDAFTHITCGS
ncbi:MAG: hypothetical protein ACRET4_06410 [Steroidobacteraceae bacterium]